MIWKHSHLKGPDAPYIEAVVEAAQQGFDGVRGHELLEDYFAQHPDADVGVILHGGLEFTPGLLRYVNPDQLIFYSPRDSTRKGERPQFLVGETHSERDLLLVDVDSAVWTAARDAVRNFEDIGYSRDKMHIYLNHGLASFNEDPLLVTIKRALQ